MGISKQAIEDIYKTSDKPSEFFTRLGNIILDEFSGIRIIGQIERPEGKDTYDALKQCLRTYLSHYRNFDALPNDVYSRSVFSLYFVWTGIFHYGEEEGSELWPHVFEGLGISDDQKIENNFGCVPLFAQRLISITIL